MSYTVNSEAYYNNIRNKLEYFRRLVAIDNSVNIQSLNIHAEGFFAQFLNCLFGWQLRNVNMDQQNVPGIDLLDEKNKIIVQVSSTYTHDKIQRSLEKSKKPEYYEYHFYFVAITEEEKRYRAFTVPKKLFFDKDQDVLNIPALLRRVQSAGIDKQKALSELMDKYFESSTAVQNNNWIIISSLPKAPDVTKAHGVGLQTANADYLMEEPQIFRHSDVAKKSEENTDPIIDIENTPVLFSVGTKMAYDINERFYNGIHYVWCAPYFNSRTQPPTSNPWDLFIEYAKFAYKEDNHATVIENNKTGIMKGARARKEQRVITVEQYNAINSVIRDFAKREDFFPVIYIIPLRKLENYETRCKKVSKEEAASANSEEYIIEDLKREEFHLIDLTELPKRIN